MYLSYWARVVLIGILGISNASYSYGQRLSYEQEIQQYIEERTAEFQDTLRSPLRQDAHQFEGFHYFPIDSVYRVTAHLTLTQDAKPFQMPTSDPNIQKTYVSYGILRFDLKGETHQLRVYKNLRLSQVPMYKDYLFLPFRDQTTGRTTYGGGRYIDLRISEPSDGIIIDFNKSYFPNCYYSEGWSCPIPPVENTLNIAVEAGEKLPDRHDSSSTTINQKQ